MNRKELACPNQHHKRRERVIKEENGKQVMRLGKQKMRVKNDTLEINLTVLSEEAQTTIKKRNKKDRGRWETSDERNWTEVLENR